jgi:hypothetical protein
LFVESLFLSIFGKALSWALIGVLGLGGAHLAAMDVLDLGSFDFSFHLG